MATVTFFTAISYGNQPKSTAQSLQEMADDYFYFGGKKALVIPGQTQQGNEGTILIEDSPAFLSTALKVISYLTIIIPVVMLIGKAILRSTHTYYVIDTKQKLEEGINVSQATIEKIQALLPKITNREKDPEITWHATGNNLVFSLASVPDLIFKIARGDQTSARRFENMVKAKEVCLAHQLGLLIIPHAKIFNVGGATLIAEERIPIRSNETVQEQLYQELGGLDETIRQLATFIAKTDFSDVEWRNMPIADDAPEFPGSRRVALVDLEEMNGARTGIFGSGTARRGLIHCLSSEEQIDIAITEAGRHGLINGWVKPDDLKARRMEEIQSYKQLQQFYEKNGIVENPRKPIQVNDLTSLDLNLEEQGSMRTFLNKPGTGDDAVGDKPMTLREAVVGVIAQINEEIAKAPEDASIKGKRYVYLHTNPGNLFGYNQLGRPKDKLSITEAEKNQLWLPRIINALVAKGHLFKRNDNSGDGYLIQA